MKNVIPKGVEWIKAVSGFEPENKYYFRDNTTVNYDYLIVTGITD